MESVHRIMFLILQNLYIYNKSIIGALYYFNAFLIQVVGQSNKGTDMFSDGKFKHFGYCPQGNIFVPQFTARETLRFYGKLHGSTDPDLFAEQWLRVM